MNYLQYILALLALGSAVISLNTHYNIVKGIVDEYKRRAAARDKYLTHDRFMPLTGLIEDEFYYPELTYRKLFKEWALFGILGLNLLVVGYFGAIWAYREFNKWLDSPVLPW